MFKWFTRPRQSLETVDLRLFVRDAIIDIVDGVREAQIDTGDEVCINPPKDPTVGQSSEADWVDLGHGPVPVQSVSFDVAVTAVTGEHSKAGIGVIAGAVAGASGGSARKHTTVSRISFDVRIAFPSGLGTYERGQRR